MNDDQLRIEYVPLSQAELWDVNPKKHDLGSIAESIKRHGFKDPPKFEPALNNGRGGIVEGNGRIITLRMMQQQGQDRPRGIGEVEGTGEWAIPILFGVDSGSETAAQSYAISHNDLVLAGADASLTDMMRMWDDDKLLDVLVELGQENELPVEFEEADVLALLNQREEPPPDVEPQVDRAEELQEIWKVETGQVWQCGEHRVVCGDCTDTQIVRHVMGSDKAVLLHADPPYGMGKEKDGIRNDNLYREKLDAFQMRWWGTCRPFVEDNGSAYIWGNAEDLWRLWFVGGLRDSERLTFRNEIVWDKGGGGYGVGTEVNRCYFPSERCLFFMLGEQGFNTNADNYWEGWEPIRAYLAEQVEIMGWSPQDIKHITGVGMFSHWFTKSQFCFITEEHYRKLQNAARNYDAFKRDYDDLKRDFYATRAYFDNTHDNMTDVWEFPRVVGEERWGHATPKPLEELMRIVKSSSPAGDIVLDPFLGSGTTLIACQQLGRKCRGVEIEPKYVSICLQRFLDVTGIEPVLLG